MAIATKQALNPNGIDGDYVCPPFSEHRLSASGTPTPDAAVGGRANAAMSDAEIAFLVSQSLEDALLVMGDTNPEATLRTRARGRRRASHRILASLPPVQSGDATVRAEFRKALLLQNLTLDIALEIVAALKRYARASGETGAMAMT